MNWVWVASVFSFLGEEHTLILGVGVNIANAQAICSGYMADTPIVWENDDSGNPTIGKNTDTVYHITPFPVVCHLAV